MFEGDEEVLTEERLSVLQSLKPTAEIRETLDVGTLAIVCISTHTILVAPLQVTMTVRHLLEINPKLGRWTNSSLPLRRYHCKSVYRAEKWIGYSFLLWYSPLQLRRKTQDSAFQKEISNFGGRVGQKD